MKGNEATTPVKWVKVSKIAWDMSKALRLWKPEIGVGLPGCKVTFTKQSVSNSLRMVRHVIAACNDFQPAPNMVTV